MTHDLRLGVICCYNWPRLNSDCKGLASLWWLSGVINPTPFLSLVLAGKYFKYNNRTSRIPSIIYGLAEIKEMLAAECRGVLCQL